MKNHLITLTILATLIFGAKLFLEHTASTMLGEATEMVEDGQYEKALEQLRDLDAVFAWTPAGKEAEELREQVRKKIKGREQGQAEAAERAQWDRKTAEDRRRDEDRQEAKERMDQELERQRNERLDDQYYGKDDG